MFVGSDVVGDDDGENEFDCVDDAVGPVLFCEECGACQENDSGGEEPVEEPHGFSGCECFA